MAAKMSGFLPFKNANEGLHLIAFKMTSAEGHRSIRLSPVLKKISFKDFNKNVVKSGDGPRPHRQRPFNQISL